MSGTNAIHGIVLLGGLLVLGLAGNDTFNKVILVIAIIFGTINVVGGFLVTDRMLEMFKAKPKPQGRDGEIEERRAMSRSPLATSFLQDQSFIDVLYIVAFALFIQGLRGLAGPDDGGARQPHRGRRHGDRGRRDAARSRRWATGA